VAIPIRLEVEDSFGLTDTSDTDLKIFDNQPAASFSANPNPAACNQGVSFDGSSSSHGRPDRGIVSYEWDFDYDGTTFDVEASGASVTNAYTQFGSYTAALRVTDDNVPAKTDVATVVVDVNQGNQAPVADADGPYWIDIGANLTLDGSGSSDPDAGCGDSIVSYEWDLDDDGQFDYTGAQVTVPWVDLAALPDLGVPIPIALRVTDSFGATDTDSSTLMVGQVSFRALDDLDPSLGDIWYGFQTAHQGVLTAEAKFEGPTDSVSLVLCDEQGNPLETSLLAGSKQRIDHNTEAGATYLLRLSGSNSDVDLSICNLVHHEGTAVTVYGTDGPDTFEFAPSIGGLAAGETAADFRVSIDGVEYGFTDAEVDTITFNGAGGSNDAAEVTVTSPGETITLNPSGAVLTAAGCKVEVVAASSITANGGGDANGCVALMNDSDGDDTLAGTPTVVTMVGTTSGGINYANTAAGFCQVHGYGRNGGHDVATLEDSSGRDKLKANAKDKWALMRGPSYVYKVRAKFFEEIDVYSTGGKDTAILYDSDGNDEMVAGPDQVTFSSADDCRYVANNFHTVIAYAKTGHDTVEFSDSLHNDVFRGLSHKSQLYREEVLPGGQRVRVYDVTARRFDDVLAIASEGFDKARLYDSSGDDLFTGQPGESSMVGPGVNVTVRGFDRIDAYSTSGGQDEADIYDTAGDDHLEAADDWARIFGPDSDVQYLYNVLAFEQVRAHGKAGGNNTKDVAATDFLLTLIDPEDWQ